MAKYIPEQHVTGELGVNQFHNYCLRHKPFIIFREESKSDFGIDGEVEIAEYDDTKKLVASGEIIKVQIKSTAKGSYIHKETETSFEFRANQDDVDYWNKHNLGVILVIFDEKNETLYAKKIDQFDVVTIKTRVPIQFDKEKNRLIVGDNDFRERFSTQFKSRVDFSRREKIALNIFPFSKLPKYLFEYKSHYKDPKEIYKIVFGDDAPNFKIDGDSIYTMYDVTLFSEFRDKIIDYNTKVRHSFKKSLMDENLHNVCAELINKQFSETVYKKKINFNRKYKRYFFTPLFQEFDEKTGRFPTRIVTYTPKKRSTATRTVVSYHEYGKSQFYRHFAFETKPILIQDQLYLIINPQYFFTSDGKNPLDDPDEITKLTNYLTAREFNQQNLNHIHFIHSYLSNKYGKLTLCEIEV
ncbi:MAG: DUF4365 domain-containing protein [Balneola sp.]